eukprot:1173134-Prorocentrum_minimum.AAC.4
MTERTYHRRRHARAGGQHDAELRLANAGGAHELGDAAAWDATPQRLVQRRQRGGEARALAPLLVQHALHRGGGRADGLAHLAVRVTRRSSASTYWRDVSKHSGKSTDSIKSNSVLPSKSYASCREGQPSNSYTGRMSTLNTCAVWIFRIASRCTTLPSSPILLRFLEDIVSARYAQS